MAKYGILIYGPIDSAQQQLALLFSSMSSVSLYSQDSAVQSDNVLSGRPVDAAFVSLTVDAQSIISKLRITLPDLPVIFYGDAPGYEAMRSAFLHGAADVINTNHLTSDDLESALRRAVNPPVPVLRNDGRPNTLNMRALTLRGQYLEQQLQEKTEFTHLSKGKQFVLLRANVICIRESPYWQRDTALKWVQEFGIDNVSILRSNSAELRLAALLEQPLSPDAAENTPLPQLQHFNDALSKIGCVSAACFFTGNSVGLSDLYHLNRLAELVYYLKESRIIPIDLVQTNTVFSENLYTRFYKAASVNDLESITDCIDTAVMHLERDMPSPHYAIMKLNRFIWDFAIAVGFQDEKHTNFTVNRSHIHSQRNDIIRLFSTICLHRRSNAAQSPLDELIRRIEFNPGAPITINQAAQETNFSRSHFCKLFRERTGMSFNEFLTAKRIENACRLLKKTGMRVDEIAHLVGISNVWYFKKLFLKAKGLSPEEWRENAHILPDSEA